MATKELKSLQFPNSPDEYLIVDETARLTKVDKASLATINGQSLDQGGNLEVGGLSKEDQAVIDNVKSSFTAVPRMSKNLFNYPALMTQPKSMLGSYIRQSNSVFTLTDVNEKTLTTKHYNPSINNVYGIQSGWQKITKHGIYTIKQFKQFSDILKNTVGYIGVIYGFLISENKCVYQSMHYSGKDGLDGKYIKNITAPAAGQDSFTFEKMTDEPMYISWYMDAPSISKLNIFPGVTINFNAGYAFDSGKEGYRWLKIKPTKGIPEGVTKETHIDTEWTDNKGRKWKLLDIWSTGELQFYRGTGNTEVIPNEDIPTTLSCGDINIVELSEGALGYHISPEHYTTVHDNAMLAEADFIDKFDPYGVEAFDYVCSISSVNGLEERLSDLEKSSAVETVTIASGDKIGLFGNSFLQGYVLEGHHPVVHLGSMTDWPIYNYSLSGDDIAETLERVELNKPMFGATPADWNLTYGIIAQQDNDGALYALDSETYYENSKKLGHYLRSFGTEPIFGTEHDVARNYYNMMRLCNEEGFMFMDWGYEATNSGGATYTPFNFGGHPSTRTHWLWTYGMKQFIDNLPRPVKTIKVYRARNDKAKNDDLKYNTNLERFKLWQDISGGYTCLKDEHAKYYDRIGQKTEFVEGGYGFKSSPNEYFKLQTKQETPISKKALVEFILPYTATQLQKVTLHLRAKADHIYLKRNTNLLKPLKANRVIAFGIGANDPNLFKVGSTLTVSKGSVGPQDERILTDYEITGIVNGVVFTKTAKGNIECAGPDRLKGAINGVPLEQELESSYDYPNADYSDNYNKPLCEWDEIVLDENYNYSPRVLKDYMDYDKLSVLLVKDVEPVTITDLSAELISNGTGKKHQERRRPIIKPIAGTSLIKDHDIKINKAKWKFTKGNSSVVAEEPIDYEFPAKLVIKSGPLVEPTTYTESYPSGSASIIKLHTGTLMAQQVSGIRKDAYMDPMIQVRVVARYFPTVIDTDDKVSSPDYLTPLSYPCATLKIGHVDSDNTSYFAAQEVGMAWNLFTFNIPVQSTSGDFKLGLFAENDNIEIAAIEVDQIENYVTLNTH